jgi:hypothetical protein
MKSNNAEQIRKIVEAVDISVKKEIWIHGKMEFSSASDPYMQTASGKILFGELHKLIYRKFYIQPCKPLTDVEPTKDELQHNIALLSKANMSAVGFDEGWIMENNDDYDSLIAHKDKYRIQLRPGEFLNVRASSANKENTQQVKIYRPKEYAGINEAFYFAYGNSIYNSDDDFIVRFYFNAGFEGNVQLMNLLTAALNEAKLQFIFKCLIHPYYYSRSDTSVLYVNKQDADFVCNHLKSIYPLIGDSLRESLPLFVYPVEKGIGFAEQPSGSPNESFGTHWSKIIAAGMMNAYENNLHKEKWYSEVLNHIQDDYGYSDNLSLYKNSKSCYPYSFITV